jgi:putative glutamine amidotransferase
MQGFYVHEDYQKAILGSGGIPIILPVIDRVTLKEYAQMCDGVILSGGEDVDPQFYQEDPHQKLGFVRPERDEFEIELVHEIIRQNKPLFGVCRGIQLLNVALGGTLIQDIPSQRPESMQHFQTVPRNQNFHSVSIIPDSVLSEIFQTEQFRVNSLHHQAIDKLSPLLKSVAFANDNTIEAVEHKDRKNIFAVQWHPESLFSKDKLMQNLFRHFVSIC